MNRNIRLRVSSSNANKWENANKIKDTANNEYRILIDRDCDRAEIMDASGVVISQMTGAGSLQDLIQTVMKELVDNLSCEFAVDSVAENTSISPAAPSEVTLSFEAVPTSGSFALEYDGDVVGTIAAVDEIQDALTAVTGLEDVTVTGSFADDVVITMGGVLSPSAVTVSANTMQIDRQVTITFDLVPDAGDITLTYNGETTNAIAFDAVASDVQTELSALTGLADIEVTGNFTDGFVLTLVQVAAPAAITVDTNTLENNTDPVTPTITVTRAVNAIDITVS